MRDLARRHGPVMLLRLGEVPTVVVSSREGAREAMKTHDAALASRPLNATVVALTNGGRDIIFAPYGDHWRQLRKLAVVELLSARRALSFRAVREEEAAAMLRAVAGAAGSGAAVVDMRARLSAFVTDVSARVVLGDRCRDRDRELFLRQFDSANELAASFTPVNLWPSSWLAGRLSPTVRRAEECRRTVYGMLDGIIWEHLERMDGGGGASEAEDLVDVLLKIQKEGGLQIPLDMDEVKAVIFDMFAAGSETSATAMEWAMAELVRNPGAMWRATAEVRGAFAAHGAVAEHTLGELRYLHLAIREAFRLHLPLPLLLPRESLAPFRVLGFDLPRGTTVVVNAWALGRDERYWGSDPEAFRPERFEVGPSGGGGGAAELKGADFELLPFGAGRRMCPGMLFGLASVELALASLLFHFDWEAPGVANPAELDMAEAFAVTVRRKSRLLLRPVLRVPVPGV